jgi:hypothetical protein
MKNASYDSLYLPQSLIDDIQEFDNLLENRDATAAEVIAHNARIRKAMREIAGLKNGAENWACGSIKVKSRRAEEQVEIAA